MLNQFITDATQQAGVPASKLVHRLQPTYGQCAEDTIVASLLTAHLTRTGRDWQSVFYMEIGANHPIATSNTYLLYKKGAAGVLVEPNPDLLHSLRKVRTRDEIVPLAVVFGDEQEVTLHVGNVSELSSIIGAHVRSFGEFDGQGGIEREVVVPAININELLHRYAGTREIDFLSVDCEGMDYELIESIDFETFRPLIIQCEPSEHFAPGNIVLMISLLELMSYRLIARTNVNLIFMRLT